MARSVGSLSTHFKRHSLNILHASTSFLFLVFALFLLIFSIRRICSVWSNTKFQVLLLTDHDTWLHKPFDAIFRIKSVDFAWDSMYLFVSFSCFDDDGTQFISTSNKKTSSIWMSYLKKKYNMWREFTTWNDSYYQKYFMTRFYLKLREKEKERESVYINDS